MSNQMGAHQKIQKFGRTMSGMVMPNIGAFIAWGFITALFIPTGWIPNEKLAELVGPMITYLLPLLIGFSGGNMFGGARGGVIGAVSTMGVVIGADVPMLLGAMIMGPLGGFLMKKTDDFTHGKVPSGFEMLVSNFSAGILGTLLALLGYLGIGPMVLIINAGLESGVRTIVEAGLLPLVSLFVEPGKILFMNNALNHGVLAPLGIQESAELGKSIFFLIETNPGPGLGILVAYALFGKGMAKQSSPGAIIILFLGGIHEIYFPYVLMNPLMVLAVIAGGASGVFTFVLTGAGLVATPSPGSIFALLAMTPKGHLTGVLMGVLVSTIVSCAVAALVLRLTSAGKQNDFESAQEAVKDIKGKKESTSNGRISKKDESVVNEDRPVAKEMQLKDLDPENIRKIAFACDAGMGSSAMGASAFSKKLMKSGYDIEVVYYPVDEIPHGIDLVVTNISLTNRARTRLPQAVHISIKDFFNDPALEDLFNFIVNGQSGSLESEDKSSAKANKVLESEAVIVGLKSETKEEAIQRAGQKLAQMGYVNSAYVEGMLEREKLTTTYIGSNVAIPHGTNETKAHVKQTGLVILQYPEGVDFGDGNTAYLVIGIAALGDEHMTILSNIAESIGNVEVLEKLKTTDDPSVIYEQFSSIG
ncbi:PTS mannitol transporter subunit IICBA [Fusibacter sp. JL216-2]|uniref:PTS mannitol transporter subunit IICBA n=1 Tax=Fusibacter sp. JL216-2 TaxID=3071453 RepID=UPI003D356534